MIECVLRRVEAGTSPERREFSRRGAKGGENSRSGAEGERSEGIVGRRAEPFLTIGMGRI
jgi:hypothetical protein